MNFTIGTLVLISFAVSLVALVSLIWAISRSQMRFSEEDARTIFRADARVPTTMIALPRQTGLEHRSRDLSLDHPCFVGSQIDMARTILAVPVGERSDGDERTVCTAGTGAA